MLTVHIFHVCMIIVAWRLLVLSLLVLVFGCCCCCFSLFLGSLGGLDGVLRVCWCLREISFCSSSLFSSTIPLLIICWIVKSAVSRRFSTLDSLFSIDLM